jgi:hypothetical protein
VGAQDKRKAKKPRTEGAAPGQPGGGGGGASSSEDGSDGGGAAGAGAQDLD